MAEVNGMDVWITDKGMLYDVYSINKKTTSVFENGNKVPPPQYRAGQVIFDGVGESKKRYNDCTGAASKLPKLLYR